MKLISVQKCNGCGKEFQDWSYDYFFSKYLTKQIGNL
jgi:hypothetical protein